MVPTDAKKVPAIGYLSVLEHEQLGLFGGYLLLNAAARPLEFHCTAPIKPNRAQQILYGPTLESFLYGEQIGQTLVNKSGIMPEVIFTDQRAMLSLRPFIATPVALVLKEQANNNDAADALKGNTLSFQYGENQLHLPTAYCGERELIIERLALLPETVDLTEPFGRIRGAIEEAQRASRAA
jgi:hypothetical protein